jgi:hypothetical protein
MTPEKAPAAVSAEWRSDRATVWNRAEAAEPRRNARVAREYVIGLPHELSAEDRLDLARTFAQRISDRYGTVVDLAVHRAPPGGDARNHHAHVLSSTRVLTEDGLGAKSAAELNDETRRSRGIPTAREEIRQLRHEWAALVNERLQAAELSIRVDARSLWEQGSARLPQPHIPREAIYRERSGERSALADALRSRHAEQQALQTQYAAQVARPGVPDPTPIGVDATAVTRAVPASAPPYPSEAPPLSADETRRRSVERWLAMQEQGTGACVQPATGREPGEERSIQRRRDHGMALEP